MSSCSSGRTTASSERYDTRKSTEIKESHCRLTRLEPCCKGSQESVLAFLIRSRHACRASRYQRSRSGPAVASNHCWCSSRHDSYSSRSKQGIYFHDNDLRILRREPDPGSVAETRQSHCTARLGLFEYRNFLAVHDKDLRIRRGEQGRGSVANDLRITALTARLAVSHGSSF